MRAFERVRELDPLSAFPLTQLARAFDALGDFETASALYQQSTDLAGFDVLSVMPQYWRIRGTGDPDALQRFLEEAGPVASATHELFGSASVQELREMLADPEVGTLSIITSNVGLVAAALGETDLAFDAWRRTLLSSSNFLAFTWTPLMQDVRRHADFELLMRDLGLPEYWRESGWPEHCGPAETEGFVCR
jgi:tetratricopeptide (TPR) repeat protein